MGGKGGGEGGDGGVGGGCGGAGGLGGSGGTAAVGKFCHCPRMPPLPLSSSSRRTAAAGGLAIVRGRAQHVPHERGVM